MQIVIRWQTHNRQYTVDAVKFLKECGIVISDKELVATAKKLLEQNEVTPLND